MSKPPERTVTVTIPRQSFTFVRLGNESNLQARNRFILSIASTPDKMRAFIKIFMNECYFKEVSTETINYRGTDDIPRIVTDSEIEAL